LVGSTATRIDGVGSVMVLPTGSGRLASEHAAGDNSLMTLTGHVQNGVIVLHGGVTLPEGTPVTVTAPAPPPGGGQRIQVPLVHTSAPGTLHLTNAQIGELLDDEDATP
jgi:hypothetical protein